MLPEANEKVVVIRKGDAIAFPFGTVVWWLNPSSESEHTVLVVGPTGPRPQLRGGPTRRGRGERRPRGGGLHPEPTIVGDCGFRGDLMKLDANAMCLPDFYCESADPRDVDEGQVSLHRPQVLCGLQHFRRRGDAVVLNRHHPQVS